MFLDLAIVMPVYDEADCIVDVLDSWISVISDLNIEYRIIVLNDGSTDETEVNLAKFKDNKRLIIINQNNSGHGPTILKGYKKAIKIAEWVFQCDSDNEIKANYFPILWERRGEYDAVLGKRTDRKQSFSRSWMTLIAFYIVSLKFGNGITDVNIPYRLMRSSVISKFINRIPSATFAPNLLISGCLVRYGLRILEIGVANEDRKTGKQSLIGGRLIKSALKCFWQTLFFSPDAKFDSK